ncbi:MAG: hypothetical protein GY821_00370 [Gammaproteobacteria bacterium]|nr:hypothetical protein [Gammaproteobacteria bacterium]
MAFLWQRNITLKRGHTLTLSARVKNKKYFKIIKQRIVDFSRDSRGRDRFNIANKIVYKDGRVVIKADQVSLGIFCNLFNEDEVREYKHNSALVPDQELILQRDSYASLSGSSNSSNSSNSSKVILDAVVPANDHSNSDTQQAINDEQFVSYYGGWFNQSNNSCYDSDDSISNASSQISIADLSIENYFAYDQ